MKLLALIPLAVACVGKPNVGVLNNELKPCPDKPNCVSSYAPESDREHYVMPIKSSSPLVCMEKLSKELSQKDNVDLITKRSDYSHLVYTSSIMRFKDDVELYLDKDRKNIQIRSASRTGYSDMGVNRKRVESIKVISSSLCP